MLVIANLTAVKAKRKRKKEIRLHTVTESSHVQTSMQNSEGTKVAPTLAWLGESSEDESG